MIERIHFHGFKHLIASVVLVLSLVQTAGLASALTDTSTFTASVYGPSGNLTHVSTAQPGTSASYVATYTNRTAKVQSQEWLDAKPPAGTAAIDSSVTVFNPAHPKGTTQLSVAANGTGVKLGKLKPNQTAYLRYSVILPAAAKLPCGTNSLVNKLTLTVPETRKVYTDSATLKVVRTCMTAAKPSSTTAVPTTASTAHPTYSCASFTVTKGNNGSVALSNFKYTATNGAIYHSNRIDWGDGHVRPSQEDLTSLTHGYMHNGVYIIEASLTFAVPNQATYIASCSKTVTITSVPVAQPTPAATTAATTASTTASATSTQNTSDSTTTAQPTGDTTAADDTATSDDTTAPDTTAPAGKEDTAVTALPNTGTSLSWPIFGAVIVVAGLLHHFWLRRFLHR